MTLVVDNLTLNKYGLAKRRVLSPSRTRKPVFLDYIFKRMMYFQI